MENKEKILACMVYFYSVNIRKEMNVLASGLSNKTSLNIIWDTISSVHMNCIMDVQIANIMLSFIPTLVLKLVLLKSQLLMLSIAWWRKTNTVLPNRWKNNCTNAYFMLARKRNWSRLELCSMKTNLSFQ